MIVKTCQTAFLALCMAVPSIVSASDITVAKAVSLSAAKATQSVFHINMPENSVVTVGILGNDRFLSASSNSVSVSVDMKGKTAYIKVNSPGQYSVGLGTTCGTSVSVVMQVHKKSATVEMKGVLPKVVISAPEKCSL